MTLRYALRVKTLSAAVFLVLLSTGLSPGAAEPASAGELAEIRELANAALPLLAIHKTPESIPEHVFLDGNEEETSLDAYRGRILLVNFWATWCPPCRHEMPALDRLQEALGGPDFAVVAVNLDRNSLKRATEFYELKNIHSLEIHLDPKAEAAGKMRVVNLPTSLLIDRNGREIGRLAGVAEWDSESAIRFFRDIVDLTRDETTAFLTGRNESCGSAPCPDL